MYVRQNEACSTPDNASRFAHDVIVTVERNLRYHKFLRMVIDHVANANNALTTFDRLREQSSIFPIRPEQAPFASYASKSV